MMLSTHAKLAAYAYGLMVLGIARKLEHVQWQVGRLGWIEVGIWAVCLVSIPWGIRKLWPACRGVFAVLGWVSLVACALNIACGPLVPAQPWPWMFHIADIAITGLGAYLLLMDREVKRLTTP